MRIALCNEVIAAMPFERQCAFARSVGYDAIEMAPFTLTDDPARLPAARAAEWRRAATDSGISITSLHYLLRAPPGLSITASDAGQRRRTVDVMRALCGLAADLGARVLVHGSPLQRTLVPGEEDDGRKRAVDCFAAVADAAAQARVVYCIEPLSRHETQLVNTVEEAAADRRKQSRSPTSCAAGCPRASSATSISTTRTGAVRAKERWHSHPFSQRSLPPSTSATPPSSRSFTNPTAPPAPRVRSAICAA
jgi:sugar phosphate isomerase/epimerase